MSIEIITSLMFIFSSLYGSPDNSLYNRTEEVNTSKEATKNLEVKIQGPMPFEDFVKRYFEDKPILYEIAKCESDLKHWTPNGEVIRGKINKFDVGLMQINELYHAENAKKLGFDLTTIKGNLAYAEWLYNKEGTTPWIHSSSCWKDKMNTLAKK
jgi:hypothetical protein